MAFEVESLAGHQQPALLWSNMRTMPFVFPQPDGHREREMSVGAFCGSFLWTAPHQGEPPSFPPCCLCCSSVIPPVTVQGVVATFPLSQSESLPHTEHKGPRAVEMGLGSSVCISVGMDGDVVTWHSVVACCCVALSYSRGWGERIK